MCRGPPFSDHDSKKRERKRVMNITYFAFRRNAYKPEIGKYRTFDIVAYGYLWRAPIAILMDVSSDWNLVFSMIQAFNQYHLDPIHLNVQFMICWNSRF